MFQTILALPVLAPIRERLAGSSFARRIASGVFYTLMGVILWRIFSIISSIIVARILGSEGFGELNMVRSTLDVFATFAGLRLGGTVTKHIAEFRRKDPVRAGHIMKLGIGITFWISAVAAGVCLVLAPWLSKVTLDRENLAVAMALGSALLFFTLHGLVKESALEGFENFKAVAVVRTLRGILTFICIPMALLWNVNGVVAALGIGGAISLAVSNYFLRNEQLRHGFPLRVSFKAAKGESWVLWRYSLPGVFSTALLTGTWWAGRIVLAHQEDGYHELGIFGAADQWRAAILFMPAALGRAIFPMLSESFGKEAQSEYKRGVNLQVYSCWLITLPMTIAIIGSTDLLVALFGEQFAEAGRVIPVVMLAVFFTSVTQASGKALESAGVMWRNLAQYIAWGAIFLALAYWATPRYGASGLAIAHLGSYLFLALVQLCYIDLALAPGAIRQQMTYYLLSLPLLVGAYFAQTRLGTLEKIPVFVALTALSAWPVFRTMQSLRRNRKLKPASDDVEREVIE
jgi:O-antigen/teichoic acid export membrane protein